MAIENTENVIENETVTNYEATPAQLLQYQEWWKRTYGRESTAEEDRQLFEMCHNLAVIDQVFRAILAEKLTAEFIDAGDLEDHKKRKWAVVTALSTYGKKFGLTVD